MQNSIFKLLNIISCAILLFIIATFSAQAQNAQINYKIEDNEFSDIDLSEDYFEIDIKSKNNQASDPFEKINRKIFTFNDYIDRYFLEHIAKGYRKYLPKIFRNVIRNFITNISLPLSITNSLLQGKVENSLSSSSAFLINTTIGIGGLFDIANNKGIKYNREDFGQTLGRYGFPNGPYLMLPLFGPSNLRDFSGWVINKSIDPFNLNLLRIGGDYNIISNNLRSSFSSISVIDGRESLIKIIEDLRSDSFDPYSTIKSAYTQRRNSEILK